MALLNNGKPIKHLAVFKPSLKTLRLVYGDGVKPDITYLSFNNEGIYYLTRLFIDTPSDAVLISENLFLKYLSIRSLMDPKEAFNIIVEEIQENNTNE